MLVVARVVCLAIAAGAMAAARQNPATFRATVRTVAVYATVHDREGRLVPDLTKDDFQILDDGKPVAITTFSNDILPFTAVLLLDMSNSMASEYLRVRAAALQFVQDLLPADRLRIGTFGREVAMSPLLTSDKRVLARVLTEEVWPAGGTPLWRGATAAMGSLGGESGRRVILLLTDGADSGKDFDCAPLVRDPLGPIGPCPNRVDVRKQAIDDEFMFYAVGMNGLDASLVDIVEQTGGGHFALKDNADLAATFARVADELHHQYVLGFTPVAQDGGAHRVEVKPTRAGLTAQARKSYLPVVSR